MSQSDLPPGWTYNPSRWSERLPVLVLALTGFGIAAYLGMYQWGAFPFVWEPFFGDGSHRILKESSLAHLLPVPDAVIGAVVYLLDATAGAIGGRARWRTLPWIVLLNGLIASGLGFGGMLLAIFQPVLFHAYCTLCLASAVCSIAMVGPVMAEVLVTLQFLKRERDRDRSLWCAVCGGRLVPELKEVLRAEPHPAELGLLERRRSRTAPCGGVPRVCKSRECLVRQLADGGAGGAGSWRDCCYGRSNRRAHGGGLRLDRAPRGHAVSPPSDRRGRRVVGRRALVVRFRTPRAAQQHGSWNSLVLRRADWRWPPAGNWRRLGLAGERRPPFRRMMKEKMRLQMFLTDRARPYPSKGVST